MPSPRLKSACPLPLAAGVLFAALVTATTAAAQVGTAITPITVQSEVGGFVYIAFGPSSNQWTTAESLGGVTLFAAASPNGALLARLPILPPFPSDELLTPPGIGMLTRDLSVGPNSVRVRMTAFGGCARSFLVEAGTSPGAANIASFEQTAVLLDASGVPAGAYYLRVRAKNERGVGAYSHVLPLAVPACPTEVPDEVDDLTATVSGQTVTLTWTPPVTPPGRPITYYEFEVVNAGPPGTPRPRALLPGASSTISATLPSGTYQVLIYAGNACGAESGSGIVTFTVP